MQNETDQTLTQKDEALIAEARRTPYTDWGKVLYLRDMADTEKARSMLDRIASDLAHKEESYHI